MLLRGGSVLLPEGEFRQIDLFISGRQIAGFSGEKCSRGAQRLLLCVSRSVSLQHDPGKNTKVLLPSGLPQST